MADAEASPSSAGRDYASIVLHQVRNGRGGQSGSSKRWRPHFVELTETLPQPVYLIAIDCRCTEGATQVSPGTRLLSLSPSAHRRHGQGGDGVGGARQAQPPSVRIKIEQNKNLQLEPCTMSSSNRELAVPMLFHLLGAWVL